MGAGEVARRIVSIGKRPVWVGFREQSITLVARVIGYTGFIRHAGALSRVGVGEHDRNCTWEGNRVGRFREETVQGVPGSAGTGSSKSSAVSVEVGFGGQVASFVVLKCLFLPFGEDALGAAAEGVVFEIRLSVESADLGDLISRFVIEEERRSKNISNGASS